MRPTNLIFVGILAVVACAGSATTSHPTYTLVGYFGESGTGPGQFHEPMGIADDLIV